jgi:hypothetical protein
MKISNNRLISTGKYIEHFSYKRPFAFAFKRPNAGKPVDTPVRTEEDIATLKKIYVEQSTQRAKSKLRRLIQGNIQSHPRYKPVFLTLTFRENITELKIANKKFTHFIKRLNRKVKHNIKYVAVPEFQERGAVHYHMLILNLPYIGGRYLEENIWKNGKTDIKLCYRTKGIYHYITKYLTKSFADPRCKGAKRYFHSLDHPIITIRNNALAFYTAKDLKEQDLENEHIFEMKDIEGNVLNKVVRREYYVGGWLETPPPTISSRSKVGGKKYNNGYKTERQRIE